MFLGPWERNSKLSQRNSKAPSLEQAAQQREEEGKRSEGRQRALRVSAMTHPFADYNKYQNQGVLVGNWVEEHALKTSTGTHRYEVSRRRPVPTHL